MPATIAVLQIPDPALVLEMGPPASGKSHFCQRHFESAQIVNPDTIRGWLTGNEADQTIHRETFDMVHKMVERRLQQRQLTVLDATTVNVPGRRFVEQMAKRYATPVCAIVLDPPLEVCLERNRQRARFVPEDVIARYKEQTQKALEQLQQESVQPIYRLIDPDAVDGIRILLVPVISKSSSGYEISV